MKNRLVEISDSFLAQLKEDIARRRISRGMARLKAHRPLLASLDPQQKNAGAFAGYLAQWVDIGFDRPALVKRVVALFSKPLRARLPLRDYAHLRMAEGMAAMAEEAADEAIGHFDFVVTLGEEVDDKESLAIAAFWKGRCLRTKGEYDEALAYTLKSRDLALALGHPRMAAVIRVLESWLFFQKGKAKEAARILQEAEAVLEETDDYVTLGNIQSSYGRMALQEGRYQQAIEHFTRAIGEYRKRDPEHRNLARSLANMAFVKRLVALELRRKIDREVVRRRKAAAVAAKGASLDVAARGGPAPGGDKLPYRQRFERLRQEAFAHLDEAAAIYRHHPHHHGAGSVHLNYGYLHLDHGDLDRADREAAAAYELGQGKKDYILMARARLLRCMTENAKVEEEIGEGADPGSHARLAQDCARDSIELAKHTQSRRLLGSAYIWQGLTQANDFFDNPEAARQSYDLAAAFLKGDHPDYMWEDLQALKAKLLRTGTVDAALRAWSQGSVGGKTFQQITEEFAELIIPRVWEREGRKVSRVAARLSISPKKVRRILGKIGRRKPART